MHTEILARGDRTTRDTRALIGKWDLSLWKLFRTDTGTIADSGIVLTNVLLEHRHEPEYQFSTTLGQGYFFIVATGMRVATHDLITDPNGAHANQSFDADALLECVP